MVRTNNNSKFVRVGKKVIRIPTTQSQKKRFEKVVNVEQTRLQQEALKRKAAEIDNIFMGTTFNSVTEFKQEISKIPTEIRGLMKFNLNKVIEIQKKSIQPLFNRLKIAQERASTQSSKSSRKGWNAEANALSNLIPQLKGKILSSGQVKSILNQAGKIRSATQNKVKKEEKQIKLINFNTKRGKQQQLKIDKFIGKGLTIGELRKKGLSFKEISQIGQVQLNKSLIQDQQKQFSKSLGGLDKFLTPAQKKKLFISNVLTSKVSPIQNKLLKIDKNKNLNPIQKENKKRELLGINPGNPEKQGLFPKLSNQEIKNLLNTIGIVPATKTNPVRKLENYLRNEYFRIANKPANLRTNKENVLILLLGESAAVVGTVRKVPGVVWNVVTAFFSPVETVKGIYKLATDKATQQEVSRLGGEFGKKVQRGDPDAFSTFMAEMLGTLGIGKIGEIKQLAKLSPNYVKMVNGKFVLRKLPKETFTVKGRERFLKQRVQKPSIKRPFSSILDFLKGRKAGQFKRFTKDPGLILKSQSVESGGKPLSKQIELAGKEITAVNTAKEQLTSWLKRKQIIRKPIPGEDDFPNSIKTILNKFDNGRKLTSSEFARVNKWLQKNIAPNITLLERSLYLDPEKGVRISRLGIDKTRTATLRDILRGNFRLFDRQKPQVLIFENVKVAKFPKTLKDIEAKLKAGKQLTTKETNRLIAWQIKTGSGKFKPIGSTIYRGGIELEVTLAPGEVIKRIKQIGFTFIEGKKVNFVTAEVWKPTKALLEKINKAKEGKLTNKQIKALEKSLSKKLGRKIRVETPNLKKFDRKASRENLPILRVKGKAIRVLTSVRKSTPRKSTPRKPTSRKPTPRKPTPRKPTPRKSTPRKSTPRKPTPRKSTPRKPTPRKPTPRKPTPRKPTPRKPTPRKSTPPTRIIPIPRSKSLKRKGKRTGYIIQIKKGNKIVGVTKKLLPKNRAINLARKIVDRNARASQQIVVRGVTDIEDVKNTVLNNKFRLKRSNNKKVRLEVEKRKYRIDSKEEKRELSNKGKTRKSKTTKLKPKKVKKTTKKIRKGKTTKKTKKSPKRHSKKRR